MRRIGLYPGTFDPVTLGHMDVIARARKLVDHLVVGVAKNEGKGPLFSTDERVALLQAEVDSLEDLGAQVIVRGLRAVSDFEYEFQMVSMNRALNDQIETVFSSFQERHLT